MFNSVHSSPSFVCAVCHVLQMARGVAFALAFVVLAVACSSAAADCLSQFGVGCTTCVNVTLTRNHRRLLHNEGGAPGRTLASGGGSDHDDDDNDGMYGGRNRTILTCSECNPTGYVLVSQVYKSNSFGRCGEQLCSALQRQLCTVVLWSCRATACCAQHHCLGLMPP
jgi:hypothetical protein